MSGTISKTVAVVAMLAGSISAADYGLKQGDADLQSAGALAFGPDGILFVGDSKGAAVFAFETGESQQKSIKQIFEIPGIGKEIAAVLGTTADDVLINDLAVSPGGNIYLSCFPRSRPGCGSCYFKDRRNGTFSELSFKNVKFAKAQLPNAPRTGWERASESTCPGDYGSRFCRRSVVHCRSFE